MWPNKLEFCMSNVRLAKTHISPKVRRSQKVRRKMNMGLEFSLRPVDVESNALAMLILKLQGPHAYCRFTCIEILFRYD